MMNLGEGFIEGNILAFLGVIAAILLLLLVNRKLQLHFIYNEIAKVEDTKMKHVSEYKFLDRYGDVGEYLRLELKLCFRNKTVKTQFRMGFIIMLAFSALIAFTDVYDGTGMINFICIYNFAILSIMTLGQVMSFEGNYLDGLMSHEEGYLALSYRDHHNQERDEHDDAVQVILGTKQVIDRFLTAHKTIQIVALKRHHLPQGHDT